MLALLSRAEDDRQRTISKRRRKIRVVECNLLQYMGSKLRLCSQSSYHRPHVSIESETQFQLATSFSVSFRNLYSSFDLCKIPSSFAREMDETFCISFLVPAIPLLLVEQTNAKFSSNGGNFLRCRERRTQIYGPVGVESRSLSPVRCRR